MKGLTQFNAVTDEIRPPDSLGIDKLLEAGCTPGFEPEFPDIILALVGFLLLGGIEIDYVHSLKVDMVLLAHGTQPPLVVFQ